MRVFKFVFFILFSINFSLAESIDNLSAVLEVNNGYVRGLPPTVKNTSAYMTIMNTSDKALALKGARSSVVKSIMIHRTEQEGAMMSMHHMASLSIPVGGKLVLAPGGTHLMMMGINTIIKDGDIVDLVLLFEGGLEYSLSLPVRSVLSE